MTDAIQKCAQIQVTGSATTHQTIKLQPILIVEALGSAKTAALPTFHALRWLKAVFCTFQDVVFDGSLLPLLIT